MNIKYYGTVLVVDDDPQVLESVTLLMGAYGYTALPCSSGTEAIDVLGRSRVDAVLSDIVMPGMSGIDLLKRVHDIDPELPVMLMSAYADLEKAVEAIKVGTFDFIIKPYKPEQLMHSLERAVKYTHLVRMENDYKNILEDLNQALETLVAERTMGLMALTLADRVRNPATIIGWTCKRILEKEAVSGGLKEGLTDIIGEARKLELIVQDFQSLLKSRQSMYGYEDINEILATVLSVIEKEAAQKGVGLEISLSDAPLKINTHKNLLRVAIFHVLRNSLEATPPGGTVRVSTGLEGDEAVLIMSDTGKGIEAEALDRIFDPFFSTKQHRFGMGLPLVKQIVSEHAGNISVQSGEGKGTVVSVRLPLRWSEGRA